MAGAAVAAAWRRLLAVFRHSAWLASSTRVLVEGESMLPTLADGDRLLVSRLAYRLAAPRRGEIVLLRDPSQPGFECIKRIVALPGEQVRLEGLSVTVAARDGGTPSIPGATWRLGGAEYFVAGDNLARSHDSRAFGPIARSALLGMAWYRYAGPSGRTGLL